MPASGNAGNQVDARAQPLRLFSWTVVREVWDRLDRSAGADHATFVKYRNAALCPQSEVTTTAKLYQWFAGFPLVARNEADSFPVLRYRDLRFWSPLFRTSVETRRRGTLATTLDN